MDAGICHIKSEYIVSDEQITETVSTKRKYSNEDTNCSRDQSNQQPFKYGKNNKANRKRGQNKNRPVYKEDRTLHLCHSLVEGPSDKPCLVTNCRYVHDLEKYLATKGDDLGTECPVYNAKGYCVRGVSCRFAKAHTDEHGRNIKAPNYDEQQQLCTYNGITSELQVRLRKRDYDFSKSKKLVDYFEKLRNATKAQKTDADSTVQPDSPPVETVQKPIGSAIELETSGRDATLTSKIDFTNKLVLSPLTTLGNLPFRRICKEFGADITCGEMACAVPIVKGLTQEWALTKRHQSEDVFGVQVCGNNPTIIAQATQLLQETAKVDFIDLNIGCPIDLIYQQGGGNALMRRTNVLEVAVRSCVALNRDIPFTVKMRTGVYADKSVAHELLPLVEEWGAAAVTLHGRSREQRYTKSANWAYIEECAAKAKHMPVIGNGDILSLEEFNEKKIVAPHVSSVMIGRGALIKPWIFQEIKTQQVWKPTSKERYDMLQKYCNYGLEHWGSDTKGIETTRRFLLEWQSFLYRYIPYDLLLTPPQRINQRPQTYRGRDEMETLFSSPNANDWVRISEMLLGKVPEGYTFVPKHKANAF